LAPEPADQENDMRQPKPASRRRPRAPMAITNYSIILGMLLLALTAMLTPIEWPI
jgi:hypothetical protein